MTMSNVKKRNLPPPGTTFVYDVKDGDALVWLVVNDEFMIDLSNQPDEDTRMMYTLTCHVWASCWQAIPPNGWKVEETQTKVTNGEKVKDFLFSKIG